MRLYGNHAVPSFTVSFGNALLFIAAHKVYVDTGLHCRPKLVELPTNPPDVDIIRGNF